MRSFGYSTDSPLPVPMKKTSLSSTTNETEALKQQVKDLQKRLELEQQRSEFYQTMIDIAEREQGVQIRKSPTPSHRINSPPLPSSDEPASGMAWCEQGCVI